MTQWVVHLRALTALEGSPAQVASPGGIPVGFHGPEEGPSMEEVDKITLFQCFESFPSHPHTSRLKNIITFNLQCNQYKYII